MSTTFGKQLQESVDRLKDGGEAETALSTAVRTHLAFEVGKAIIQLFDPIYAEASDLASKSREIVVTDATQVTEIKQAREARLALRAVRLKAEKAHKDAKAESLKRGQAIDAARRVIDGVCEPEEARLLGLEQFAERAEAERKRKRVQAVEIDKPAGSAILTLQPLPLTR